MTPKTKMIEFMRKKAAIIEAACDGEIKFLSEADIKDLESWSEKICKGFLAGLAKSEGDCDLCPWCFRYFGEYGDCQGCGYKERHGDCLSAEGDSTYQQVQSLLIEKIFGERLLRGFIQVPGIAELVNEYKEKKS